MALKLPVPPKPQVGQNYAPHLHHQPITAHVTTDLPGLPSGISVSEAVNPSVATGGYAVTVEAGRTINLGNFESARVGVTLTIPCIDLAGVEDAYDFATTWVSEKIESAVKLAKG